MNELEHNQSYQNEGMPPTILSEKASTNDDEIPVVDFNYDGYQVVRGEFFSHVYEPSITFANNKVYVNTTCIKKVPDLEYMQILVNPDEKKLAVKPCKEEERDSFRWCSAGKKKSPKQITCRMFFAKVFSLMSWNHNYRYKLLGKLVKSNDELLFIFDLNSPEIYMRQIMENGKVKNLRTPVYPEGWKNQFGLTVEQHRQSVQVGVFDGFTVFGLETDPKNLKEDRIDDTDARTDKPAGTSIGYEEEPNQSSQNNPAPVRGSGLYTAFSEP